MTALNPKQRARASAALCLSALLIASGAVVVAPAAADDLPAVELLGTQESNDEFPADALGGDRSLLTADRLLGFDSERGTSASIEITGGLDFPDRQSVGSSDVANDSSPVAPGITEMTRSEAGRLTPSAAEASFAERVMTFAPVYRTGGESGEQREHYMQLTGTDDRVDGAPTLGEPGFAGIATTYLLSPGSADGMLRLDPSADGWEQRLNVSPEGALSPSLVEAQWSAIGADDSAFQLINRTDGSCLAATDAGPEPQICVNARDASAAYTAQLWRVEDGGLRSVADERALAVVDGAVVLVDAAQPDADLSWEWTPVTSGPTELPASWSFGTVANADSSAYHGGYDIAVGDVDGTLGSDGLTHDEAVVAYFDESGTFTVAVLDYDHGNSGLTVTEATVEGALAGPSFGVTVDIGDIDDDGRKEIIVTHQDGDSVLRASTLEYATGPRNTRLTTASANMNLEVPLSVPWYRGSAPSAEMKAYADTQLADFDGDGTLELAVSGANGESHQAVWYIELRWDGSALVRDRTIEMDIDQTASSELYYTTDNLSSGENPGPGWGRFANLVSGDFVTPGWKAAAIESRQVALDAIGEQLATTYVDPDGWVHTLVVSLRRDTAEPLLVNNSGPTNTSGATWASLAAGSFARGGGEDSANDSLALMWDVPGDVNRLGTMGYTSAGDFGLGPEFSYGPSGSYVDAVAYDRNGDSVLLGDPTVITVQDYVSIGMIGGQPPSHADWLNGDFENISRSESFTAQLGSEDTTSFGSGQASSTTLASGWGGSAEVGAETTIGPKFSSLTLSGSLEGALAAKESALDARTRDVSYEVRSTLDQTTADDDIVNATVQDYRVYRYPVYDPSTWGTVDPDAGCADACYPYWDVVVPGQPVVMNAPGKSLDFFDPQWQNGNAMSYPATINGEVPLGDLGTYSYVNDQGGTVTVREPLSNDYFITGGVEATQNLNVSNEANTSSEESSTRDWTAAIDVAANGTGKLKIPGVWSGSTSIDVAANVDWEQVMTNTATGSRDTSHGNAFTLNIPSVDGSRSYGFAAAYYFATDGSPRVRYAVDPTASNQSQQWWQSNYGELPDPALNLPFATELVLNEKGVRNVAKWSSQDNRQDIRGFLARQPESGDALTSGAAYTSTPTEGDPVIFDVPVHNYSLVDLTDRLAVDFYAVAVNNVDTKIEAEPVLIGRSYTDRIDAQSFATVSSPEWSAQLGDGGETQQWRIFAVVDPDDEIEEIHELNGEAADICPAPSTHDGVALRDPMTGEAEILTCGQNNQGYGLVTVQPTVATDLDEATNGSSATADAAVASTSSANLVGAGYLAEGGEFIALDTTSEIPSVEAGRTSTLVVRATGSENSISHQRVLVYDGAPAESAAIASTTLHGVSNGRESAAQFRFTPQREGMHELHVVLRDANGGADQAQIVRVNVTAAETGGTDGGSGSDGSSTGGEGATGGTGSGNADGDAGADQDGGDLATTGSDGAALVWLAILAAAAMGLGVVLATRRRRLRRN